MITVDLFSRTDCHLCHEAFDLLKRVQTDIPFDLRTIMLEPGSEFYEAYDACIPVVHINGRLAFKALVDEKALRRKLERLAG
jgi:glutaredoxin